MKDIHALKDILAALFCGAGFGVVVGWVLVLEGVV